MVPPLALDIDGTLTTRDDQIDPRVFELLPEWEAPIVVATGKSFPYPVALCHFLGIPERVVAENGGVVCADGQVSFQGDRDRAEAAIELFPSRAAISAGMTPTRQTAGGRPNSPPTSMPTRRCSVRWPPNSTSKSSTPATPTT